MNADNIVLGDSEIKFIECKFTVEKGEEFGNIRRKLRINFDGYATKELYDELTKAIDKAVDE